MNQYKEKTIPALLKKPVKESSNIKFANGTVEFELDGQKIILPTAQAFYTLLKKVSMLEQKILSLDNKNKTPRLKNDR